MMNSIQNNVLFYRKLVTLMNQIQNPPFFLMMMMVLKANLPLPKKSTLREPKVGFKGGFPLKVRYEVGLESDLRSDLTCECGSRAGRASPLSASVPI
jgi:hypothetical protein